MPRAYRSRLRDDQAEATRLRVIEAVATVLGTDISGFTIPAVAAEAGVSIATVERLFPTKRHLLDGLARHYAETIGSMASLDRPPRDIEELLAHLGPVMRRTRDLPAGMRAAVASETFR